MKRTTAYGAAAGMYTAGDPSSGIPATLVGADEMNHIQEEIISVITAAGITLNAGAMDQLKTAINTLIASAIAAAGNIHSHVQSTATIDAVVGNVITAREGLSAILDALARRLDSAVNDSINTGGDLGNLSGTSIDVAPLTGFVDGYYQTTTTTTTVTGLAGGVVNYVYILKGSGLTPTFGHDTDKATANAVYIGEVDMSGSSFLTYARKGKYDSGWQSISLGNAVTLQHNLGFQPNALNAVTQVMFRPGGTSGEEDYVPNMQVSSGVGAGVAVKRITAKSITVQAGNQSPNPFYNLADGGGSELYSTGSVRVMIRKV